MKNYDFQQQIEERIAVNYYKTKGYCVFEENTIDHYIECWYLEQDVTRTVKKMIFVGNKKTGLLDTYHLTTQNMRCRACDEDKR